MVPESDGLAVYFLYLVCVCVCVCVFLSLLCRFFFSSCFLSQCFGFEIDSVLYSIAVRGWSCKYRVVCSAYLHVCIRIFFTFYLSSSGDMKGLLGTSPRCDHLSRLDN